MTRKTAARICPRCGKAYTEPPALSRTDNRAAVCRDCGLLESLESIGMGREEQERILAAARKFGRDG